MNKFYKLLQVCHCFGTLDNGKKYENTKLYFAVEIRDDSGAAVQRYCKEWKASPACSAQAGDSGAALLFDEYGRVVSVLGGEGK